MTDNEIMKNVRCCADHYCKNCSLLGKLYCKETLLAFAWNTMYNQQSEIEKKDRILESYALQYGTAVDKERIIKAELDKLHPYQLHYGNLRMEIAREVCDRLKATRIKMGEYSNNLTIYDFEKCFDDTIRQVRNAIDNLLKEMEEECEGN